MKTYANRVLFRIMSSAHPGFDRRVQSDNYSTGACEYQEGREQGYWEPDRMMIEDYFLTLRDENWPVKLAGALATRLWRAVQCYPKALRLALITLENGNRLALPADINLTTGFNSGAMVREALFIDVRNLRARIRRLIEEDKMLVGEADDVAA